MSRSKRPLLQTHTGGGEAERTWLEDDELDSIPTVYSTDDAGLSRTAKAVYRQRRDGAGGRKFPRSFKSRTTLADALEVDYDTVLRADQELLRKGYLSEAGLHHGRTPIYELQRGPSAIPQAPQSAVLEEVPPEGSLTGAEPSGVRTAAEPTPAEAGSAAGRKRRRTGWRFVRSGPAGRYVRDPEGTDKLPRGYFDEPDEPRVLPGAPDVEMLPDEPEDVRRARAAEMLAWITQQWGGRRVGDVVEPGTCNDCRRESPLRERLGVYELCSSCKSRRLAAAMDFAGDVVRAEVDLETARRAQAIVAEMESGYVAEGVAT